MIDTVKFKIQIDEDAYKELTKSCDIHLGVRKMGDGINVQKYLITKSGIELGSHHRLWLIRMNDRFIKDGSNFIFLEMSIPKYVFGHNVRMIDVDTFKKSVESIQKELATHRKITSPISEWEIMRLDICYSWKLKSKKELENSLIILQNLRYPRKKKYNYDTSVMFKGSSYTVKFYSKYEEFLKHDFKHLTKYEYDSEFIDKIHDLAKNVLRFEVTIRRKHFKTVFRRIHLRMEDITEEVVVKTLNSYLKKLIKLIDVEKSKAISVYDRLVEEFGEVKGRDVYEKFRLFTSLDPTDQKVYNSYSYPNRYKFLKNLEKTGVGLLSEDMEYQINLKIPSENAVY